MSRRKPALSISLSGTEGNAFAIIAKAHRALEEAVRGDEARSLISDFTSLARRPGSTYKHVKKLAGKYCSVTWLK